METKTSMWPLALKWGLITGFAVVIFNLILYLIGESYNNTLNWVAYLILAISLFIAIKSYRDHELNGYLRVSNALGLGTVIALISGIVAAIYFLIYANVLDPGYMDEALRVARENAIERGVEGDTLEQQMKMVEKFMTPGFILFFSLLWNVVVGFVLSIIAGLVFQNKQAE